MWLAVLSVVIAAAPTKAERVTERKRDGLIISIATVKIIATAASVGNINLCSPCLHPTAPAALYPVNRLYPSTAREIPSDRAKDDAIVHSSPGRSKITARAMARMRDTESRLFVWEPCRSL